MDQQPFYPATHLPRSAVGSLPLPAASPADAPSADQGSGKITPFAKGDKISFRDVLDIVNPLQHIPVVNYIYQKITGDTEGAVADVVGGTLWGGPIGMVSAMADLTTRSVTGSSIGDHVVALFKGKSSGSTDTAVADAAQPDAAQPDIQPGAQPQRVADAGPVDLTAAQPLPAVTSTPIQPARTAAAPNNVGRAGDYLVFGNPAAPAPAAAGVRSLFTTPLGAPDPSAGEAGASPPVMASAMAAQAYNSRSNFKVFGANGPAATSLPGPNGTGVATPVVASADAPPAASTALAAPMAATDAANTAMAGAAASASAPKLPLGFRPLPARASSINPPANLPPPTTGPGALPGGHSQAMNPQQFQAYRTALRAAAAAAGNPASGTSAASTPAAAASQDDTSASNTWFVNQFNAAMDKYQRGAQLGGGANPAVPTLPAAAATPISTGAGSVPYSGDPSVPSTVFAMPGMMVPPAPSTNLMAN